MGLLEREKINALTWYFPTVRHELSKLYGEKWKMYGPYKYSATSVFAMKFIIML